MKTRTYFLIAACLLFALGAKSQTGFQSNSYGLYYLGGKVGIGTSSPEGILTVNGGDVILRSLPANKNTPGLTTLALQNYGATSRMHGWNLYTASYAGAWGVASNAFEVWEHPDRNLSTGDSSHRRFVIETGRNLYCNPVIIGPKGSLNIGYDRSFHATDANDLSVNGNVGIGTLNTNGYKLAVNGTVRAKEVRVNSDWADFVFKKEYELPTLKAVEEHINEKGRLPNIPSESEVKANGVDLGEINALLLQKVEELTLYIIQQQKQIDTMQIEMKEFKSTIGH